MTKREISKAAKGVEQAMDFWRDWLGGGDPETLDDDREHAAACRKEARRLIRFPRRHATDAVPAK